MRRREIRTAVPFSRSNHRSGLAMADPGRQFISNDVDWQMGQPSRKLSDESNKC
jgi:hypothetical protein